MAEADRDPLRLTPGPPHRGAHQARHAPRRGLAQRRVRERGHVIYPGKLTVAGSFRVGCTGQIAEAEMRGALDGCAPC